MKRARPQGLGSASKKDKTEEEQVNTNVNDNQVENVSDQPAAEGTGKLIYELPEDATALDQLRALFESATMFLGNYKIQI